MVTEKPLACSNLPSEAEIIPLPNEEVTPPVTKIYLAVDMDRPQNLVAKVRICPRSQALRFQIYKKNGQLIHYLAFALRSFSVGGI